MSPSSSCTSLSACAFVALSLAPACGQRRRAALGMEAALACWDVSEREEDAACPGSHRLEWTQGSCRMGKKRPVCDQTQDSAVRKTQLGQGQMRGDRQRGSCCEGDCDRPANQSGTGAVRATQPYDVMAGQCAWNLRPNRVTVAPQASEMAGVRGALRPGCPVLRTGIGGAMLDPSTDSRSGKALVPPGRPLGERGSILPV